MPTTARRCTPGRTPKAGNRGHEPDDRPDDPEGRVGPSDRAHVHHVDPDQPVHGLPHAPRHQHGRRPTWASRGGTTRPTARRCIRAAEPQAVGRSSAPRSRSATRRAARSAACGRIRRSCSRPASPEFNAQLKQTQFADFHGHGWLFRAVFKRDRKGNLLDAHGQAGDGRVERGARRSRQLHRPARRRRTSARRSPSATPSAPASRCT